MPVAAGSLHRMAAHAACVDDGFLTRADPSHAYHALDSHILGFTLWQLGHSARREDITPVEQDFARLRDGVSSQQLRADGYPYLAEHAEQHIAWGRRRRAKSTSSAST